MKSWKAGYDLAHNLLLDAGGQGHSHHVASCTDLAPCMRCAEQQQTSLLVQRLSCVGSVLQAIRPSIRPAMCCCAQQMLFVCTALSSSGAANIRGQTVHLVQLLSHSFAPGVCLYCVSRDPACSISCCVPTVAVAANCVLVAVQRFTARP